MVNASSVPLPEIPGLVWEPLEVKNRDDLLNLIAGMERIDNPPYRTSPAEVDQILNREFVGLGGWNQDSHLVAYATVRLVDNNGYQAICSGGVAVNWRKKGVGTEILQWQVKMARKMLEDVPHPAQIVCLVDQVGSSVSGWMNTFGFEKAHSFQELRRDLSEPIEPISAGRYLEIIPWNTNFDDHVRRAHNELMHLTSGSPAQDMESWTANRPFFAPKWSFIALDKSSDVAKVAGYLLSACYEQDWEAQGWKEGYIEMVGVLPEYSGMQVAPALLTNALEAYRNDGMDYAAVGIADENPTEIAKLYRNLGFKTTGESTIWTVDVDDKPTVESVARMNRLSAFGLRGG